MSAARRDSSPPPPPPPINSDWDMVQRQNASFAARTMVSVNAGANKPAAAAAAAAAKPNGAAAAAAASPSANGSKAAAAAADPSGAARDDKSDAKGESKQALWPAKPEKKEDGKYSGVKAIVIDNGTAFTKAGFAGEDAPRTLFPSVVGRPRYNVDVDGSGRSSFVGKEAQQKRSSLALKNPIEHGVVVNWDDMEALWDHIFQYELKVQPEEYHVLLTEAPLNPKANRERMMQIMFETFQVPAAYVALTGALSLYGNGQTTGFVLECGEGVTHTVPIFDGQVLHHQITRLDFAGRNVTELLMRLMNAREEETGYSFSTSVERDTIRRMKEATCYIVMDYEKELGRAKLSASNAAAVEKKFVLPDGKSITVGTERFTAAEGLFRPTLLHEEGDSEIKGVHEACYRCITKCDMTLRRYFLENIVLSGGSCLFPGFEERLAAEITKLMPQTGLVKVKVKRELNAQQLVWAGGSVLSSLSGFAPMWITREDYDEVGPAIVHIKCP